MAGYERLKEVIDSSFDGGQFWYTSFRKVSAITTVQANWFDLSMAPGNPRPNYYATGEKEAAVLTASKGMYHGGDVSPKSKYLHKLGVGSFNAGVAPATFMLCDYLLYYPLIDMDSTDEQLLDNTVTLPRYTTGEGVRAFIVATNPYVGGALFQLTFTDSDGNTGCTSRILTSNVTTQIGTIIHSGTPINTGGPFLPLGGGDTGIRSVQSAQFSAAQATANGCVNLVLYRPLLTVPITTAFVAAERDLMNQLPSLPRLRDGACLGILVFSGAVIAAGNNFQGYIDCAWG